jgi:hypothetical protein
MQLPVAVEIFDDVLRNHAYTMQVAHKATNFRLCRGEDKL